MKHPCESCLVKACCKIKNLPYFYKCGCDKIEIYRTLNMLNSVFKGGFAYINLTKRLKELGIKYEESL